MKNKEMFVEDGVPAPLCPAQGDQRPRVLLIGDSIRIGYCETVKAELADVAVVVYPAENCRFTQNVLTNLRTWRGLCEPQSVKAVLFNCGHWDAAHWEGEEHPLNEIPQYAFNIGRIYDRLRAAYPQAQVVFATSTPMNPNGSQGVNPRTTQEMSCYNAAARQVMEEKGGQVLDLFAVAAPWGPEAYQDYAHFTEEYFAKLGHQVAEHIRALL